MLIARMVYSCSLTIWSSKNLWTVKFLNVQHNLLREPSLMWCKKTPTPPSCIKLTHVIADSTGIYYSGLVVQNFWGEIVHLFFHGLKFLFPVLEPSKEPKDGLPWTVKGRESAAGSSIDD